MLIYHPAYDTNHSVFRMLRLLEKNSEHTFRWDTFRILDFYYLFPHLIEAARLPREFLKQKRAFSRKNSKYNRVPSPRLFIQQLAGIHETAARSLIGKGLVDATAFEQNRLQRTAMELPGELSAEFYNSSNDEPLVEFLSEQLASIPLAGPDGLKARTGLLEHRYDVA